MAGKEYYISIAEHNLRLSFAPSEINGIMLLPALQPFIVGESQQLLTTLHVDDTLRPIAKEQRELIRDVDTGNGHILVYEITDEGGYQFIIKDIFGASCCLLITDALFTSCQCALNGDAVMRTFGLNNAMMLIYAFAGSFHDTLLIHASLVRKDGYGYAFTAKSGTGKSTHVNMWLQNIEGCDMMNDDNPVVRVIDGEVYIYGSPWSGKTPCYRNVKARLGAITRIERAKQNHLGELSAIESFTTMLTACSTMKWDVRIYNNICDIITKIVEHSRLYVINCRPNAEAAKVCYTELQNR